jgi:hypothetical protein
VRAVLRQLVGAKNTVAFPSKLVTIEEVDVLQDRFIALRVCL